MVRGLITKTLFLLAVLVLSLPSRPQILSGVLSPVNAGGCSPFTDLFSGSGALSANWTAVPSLGTGSTTIVQASGVAEPSNDYNTGVEVVTGCASSSTPYAQVTISNIAGAETAVELFVHEDTSGNGYEMSFTYSSLSAFLKCTAGTCSYAASTTCTPVNGSVLKFTASGTTSVVLTAYIGGVSCGTWTDTTSPYTGGYNGMGLASNTANVTDLQVDNFVSD